MIINFEINIEYIASSLDNEVYHKLYILNSVIMNKTEITKREYEALNKVVDLSNKIKCTAQSILRQINYLKEIENE